MDHYSNLFTSSDNQFGFKKKSGCAQAIYVFRCVIDHYVNSGSTVNVCAIDVSKAPFTHRALPRRNARCRAATL